MKNWKLILAFLGSLGAVGCSKPTETCQKENSFGEYANTNLKIDTDGYRLRVEKTTTVENNLENYQVVGQKEIWEKWLTCNQTGEQAAGKGEKAAFATIDNVGGQLLHYAIEMYDTNCDGTVDYFFRWMADGLDRKWSEHFIRLEKNGDYIGRKSDSYRFRYFPIDSDSLDHRTKDLLFKEADLRFNRIKNRLDFYLRREKKSSLREEFKSFQDKYKKDSD